LLLVTAIAVTPGSGNTAIKGPVGYTKQFTATATYGASGTGDITATATWTSSATQYATIGSTTGVATLVAPGGHTNIRATFGAIQSPFSDQLTVQLTSILLSSPYLVTLTVGGTQQLTATGLYSDSTNANITSLVTWASTASSASISATMGSVTSSVLAGVSAGTSLGTATVSYSSGTGQDETTNYVLNTNGTVSQAGTGTITGLPTKWYASAPSTGIGSSYWVRFNFAGPYYQLNQVRQMSATAYVDMSPTVGVQAYEVFSDDSGASPYAWGRWEYNIESYSG
jgi:hypothetical protein